MGDVPENPSVEASFDQALRNLIKECDKYFTSEEGHGRFVDMYHLYNMFINLKKILREAKMESGDYLNYLQNFFKLKDIPLHLKDSTYISYIEAIHQYLFEFVKKSQPLVNHEKFEQENRNF